MATNETILDLLLKNNSQDELAGDMELLRQHSDKMLVTQLPAIIYTCIMMTLGLPGNIIVFYIYFFKWRRSTSRVFILFLAALDTLNCSITMPMEIYIMQHSLKLDQPVLCKMSRYGTYVINSSSALILVGIATDRFIRICRPYQQPLSAIQCRNISLGAIIFSMATTWPSLFLYGTRKVHIGNAVGSVCLLENKYDNTPYPFVYFISLSTTTTLTFSALIVLYYFIGLQIYRHRKFKLRNCTSALKMTEEKIDTEKLPEENVKYQSNVFKYDNDPSVEDTEDTKRPAKDENDFNKNTNNEIQVSGENVETSHCLLKVPSFYEGKECAEPLDGYTSETKIVTEQLTNNLKGKASLQSTKSDCNKQKGKKTNGMQARYLLVREASTGDASRPSKTIKCLTIRVGRSTLMLFLITIAYVLSFLPFYSLVIVRQSDSNFVRRLSTSELRAYHVFLRSYLLSSVVNPFIYSFCNIQFRNYCKETLSNFFLRRKSHLNLR